MSCTPVHAAFWLPLIHEILHNTGFASVLLFLCHCRYVLKDVSSLNKCKPIQSTVVMTVDIYGYKCSSLWIVFTVGEVCIYFTVVSRKPGLFQTSGLKFRTLDVIIPLCTAKVKEYLHGYDIAPVLGVDASVPCPSRDLVVIKCCSNITKWLLLF